MNIKTVSRNALDFARSTAGKVSAGAAGLMASGFAMAGGGPAEAITSEITSGKTSVNGILVLLASVLGLFLLWSMIKRAK